MTTAQKLLDWLRFEKIGQSIAYHDIEQFASSQRARGFCKNMGTWDRAWRKLLTEERYKKYGITIQKINNGKKYDQWQIN